MRYRTVWLSDLHLGTRGAHAQALLDFLKETECDKLYLVGDIIDVWRLRRERHWPQLHNDVVQKILRKARKGARVIYIPGNHDEFCRHFLGSYGRVTIKTHDVHTTATGQRLLVMHGHEFDEVTLHARWLAVLGDVGYNLLLRLNRPLNAVRRLFGCQYWSLSAYAKSRVKNAVSFISRFEDVVTRYAERHQADGIVCGHIHTPAARLLRDLAYYNTGDWVESCSAVVEHLDGRMELLHRPPVVEPLPAATAEPWVEAFDLQDRRDLLEV
jgi:UDP-2,3-diacylglucosamine pyrophosphatase LpxH